jgi:hypothetical protein
VASRGRAGVWGKPKIVCACMGVADAAVNASGQAVVVWSPSETGLWAKTRSSSGRWSAAQRISRFGTGLYYMALALNSRGGAVVAWNGPGNKMAEYGRLEVAIRGPRGRFGRTQTIGVDPYWGFIVALAPTGEATVVWETYDCGFSVSRLPGASSFGSKQNLGCDPYDGQTVPETLAMDAHGNTLALWLKADVETDPVHIYLHAAERPAGGSFDTGTDIGDMGLDSYKHTYCGLGGVGLAVTPDGSLALAAWLARPQQTGTCTQVQATTSTR